MSVVSLTTKDGISPAIDRLIKKTKNMTPAMRQVRLLVMAPLKSAAWQKSGLKSRSGELKGSVQTWHGKKSAGISVHTTPGQDLVIPKAILQTGGAKRYKYRKHRQYKVKEHSRGGRRIGRHLRRNYGAPWGDIKARPFIPAKFGSGEVRRITKIITDFIDV